MSDNPNLPESGVRLVAEDFESFRKVMAAATKMIEDQGKKAEEAAKKAQKNTDATGKFEKGINKLLQRFTSGNPAVQKATSLLGDFGIQLSGATLKATLAIGVVTALVAAFVALGQRGSTLVGLGESFDRLTASIGVTSTTLLQDLREASAGTVADFELIRLANVALAGAVGDFGQQFGEKLPKLLEVARVQARATGQDVNFLFQSLITGIKRGSPLLIDNTGLVLKVEEANQKYAESIGKTVSQLTAEDKQIALLNATLAAGQVAIEALGGAQETAADKIARGTATITNILDTLALAVQPAFSAILDAGNAVLAQLDQLAKAVGPIITEITNAIGGTVAMIVNALSILLQPIIDLVSGIAPYVTLALRTINTIASGVQQVILWVARQLFGFVGDLKVLPKVLFEGAAGAFGAFANGIIAAANQLIFPAVIGIAQFIADFLVGLSPPPKGPLSKIDQGGANTMVAWLEGFTGVSLQPVSEVADEVNVMLGSIGQFSLKQVETRLAQLDAALLPFQQRLDVIKASFDALAEPARAALDAIDRQIASSLEALGQGDAQAAALIRSLDAQRDHIQGVLNEQQRVVDAAQIQLALATAQQARERALLEIQKARLAVEEKVAKKRKEKGAGGAAPKEKKLTGEAPAPETPGAADAGIGVGDGSVLDDISGQGAVDEALAGLKEAFEGQINAGGALDKFNENRKTLGGLLDTIGGVDIGAKISGRFDAVKTGLETALEEARSAVETKIVEIGAFFVDPTKEGSLPNFFSRLGTELSNTATTVRTDIETAINGLFSPDVPTSIVAQAISYFDALTNPEVETSLPYKFRQLGVEFINKGVELRAEIEQVIRNIFDPEMETSITYKAKDFIDGLVNPDREGSIPDFFNDLPANIEAAVTGIGDIIKTSIIDPVAAFLTGEGEGTISGMIDGAVAFFAALPGRIVGVLQGFGLTVFSVIVKPIESVLNSLIGLFESALKGLVQSLIDVVQPFIDTLSSLGIDPGLFGSIVGALQDAQSSINFGRLNIAPPEFLVPSTGGTTNNSSTTVNNTFNISSPGGAEFAMRRSAVASLSRSYAPS